MTKAPLGGKKTGPNPTDRAKGGTKRSLLTEANGVPLAIVVAGANRNDFKLARETLESIVIARPKPTRDEPQGLCLDKGYDYDEVHELADEFRFTAHIRSSRRRGTSRQQDRRLQGTSLGGRTHPSWMNRFRRILIRWEKRPDTYLAMLHLACALITWKACGLLG